MIMVPCVLETTPSPAAHIGPPHPSAWKSTPVWKGTVDPEGVWITSRGPKVLVIGPLAGLAHPSSPNSPGIPGVPSHTLPPLSNAESSPESALVMLTAVGQYGS